MGSGDRLLEGCLAGAELDVCLAAELARGTLPAGALSGPVIERVRPVVEQIIAAGQALEGLASGPAVARSLDVKIDLPDGRRIPGTVPGVCGDVLRTVTFSGVNAHHRLAAWVRLLALNAAHPQRGFAAATVGRGRVGRESRLGDGRGHPQRLRAAVVQRRHRRDRRDRVRPGAPRCSCAAQSCSSSARRGSLTLSVETAYAMTIHKSQGSRFDTAVVLLPPASSRLLTRELLYTGVTRARKRLTLAGSEEAIRGAVARPVARASGLRQRLWDGA